MSFINHLWTKVWFILTSRSKHVYKILCLTLGSAYRDVFCVSGKKEWDGGPPVLDMVSRVSLGYHVMLFITHLFTFLFPLSVKQVVKTASTNRDIQEMVNQYVILFTVCVTVCVTNAKC